MQNSQNPSLNARSLEKQIESFRDRINDLANEIREHANALRDIWDERSEKWQESDRGQEFDAFIESFSEVADDIENAEFPEVPA